MNVKLGMLITCSFFLLGFILKKSNLFLLFQTVWLWIVTGLSNGGMDYADNEILYSFEKNSFSITTFIYDSIVKYCHSRDMSYLQYHSVMIGILLIFFVFIISKCCKYPCIVISLFYVSPMIDSVFQKRFFISMLIAFYGFYFLMKNKNKTYYIFMLIAMQFHFSACFYLIIPLFLKFIRKFGNKFIVIMYLIILGIVIFLGKIIPLLPIQGLLKTKLLIYSQEQVYSSILVGVIYCIWQFIFTYFIMYIYNSQSKIIEYNRDDKFILELNKVYIAFLPFVLLGLTYLRYYRILQIFNYIFIANSMRTKIKKDFYAYLFLVLFILWLIIENTIVYAMGVYKLNGYLQFVFDYNALLS